MGIGRARRGQMGDLYSYRGDGNEIKTARNQDGKEWPTEVKGNTDDVHG